jgi:eukaryotic-like serine/threonine-protein kinase
MRPPHAGLVTALKDRYALEREVGEGGMAVVYLARDLKHDRRVALKLLRPELGAVLGVERFLSEIRVTANLQHPNLLPLFDSGEADGQLFYVMPFVEGESLRARLDREKQLPIDAALHIATSVASALDYAHRHGVIHRDLKPENVLLHDGQPLIADFGIALAVSNAGGSRVTQTGLSLGTPQYMSPEQATGDRDIDGRSDIYSLGAVTYEMLTGEPPHIGSTSQAIIARLLTERPRDVRVTRPNVPEHVARTVDHALEKLPADRFATAREFADALAGKAFVPLRTVQAVAMDLLPPDARPRKRERAVRVALALVAGVGLAWGVGATILLSRPPELPSLRFEVTAETPINAPQFSVSPNGELLAFVGAAPGGEGTVLWIRSFDDTEPRPLPGTDGAVQPFWSPDSRFIGYYSVPTRRLQIVDVDGGPPRTLISPDANVPGTLSAGVFQGGAWNEDQIILYGASANLYQVPAGGGTPAPVVITPEGSTTTYRYPVFLPDGRRFLVLIWSSDVNARAIHAGSLESGQTTEVLRVPSKPAFAAPGYLLFNRDGSLFAQELDPKSLLPRGEARLVQNDVQHNASNGFGAFSLSTQGVLAFRAGEVRRNFHRLEWFTRRGDSLEMIGEALPYSDVRLSPDDRMVAAAVTDSVTGNRDLWTIDLGTGVSTRFTFDAGSEGGPTWFPSSRELAYLGVPDSVPQFYRKRLGASAGEAILESPAVKFMHDISADGRLLLYQSSDAGREARAPRQLMTLPLSGGGAPIPLGDTLFGKDEARFSPNGRWISFGSVESGSWEVYVASFPGFDDKKKVSIGGGVQGRWRGDSGELFYVAPDGTVMSVTVGGGATLELSAPEALFRSPLRNPDHDTDEFNVTKDGQRFLMSIPAQSAAAAAAAPITVVLNWQKVLQPN